MKEVPGTAIRVVDNPAEKRYEAWVGEELAAVADYRRASHRVIFFHTETDPAFSGRGIGQRLVKDALDDVRARGLVITPKCPFFAAYIRRHPEYQDLVVSPSEMRQRASG